MKKKVAIFSAPSGSGKTTVVKHLISKFPSLEFSISATTRQPRGSEVDGRDYYFLSEEEFKNLDPRNISSISIAKGASSSVFYGISRARENMTER